MTLFPDNFHPFVSVIIPTNNNERFIGDAINSILCQSYRSYELIVVDDGSTDHTREIVHAYSDIRYIYQANRGVSAARNRGIQEARGDYFAFLDGDDLWFPEKLSLQVKAFYADPSLEIVSGHVTQFIDPGLIQDNAKKYVYPDRPLPGYTTNAMLIKRSVFAKTGLFNEKDLVSETIEWFTLVIDKEIKILVLPDLVAKRRIHGNNASIKYQEIKNQFMVRVLKGSIDRRRKKMDSSNN